MSMSNRQKLPTREEIINLCTLNDHVNYFVQATDDGGVPQFIIKYGYDIMGEPRTQQYLLDHSRKDPGAPRIPEIYDSFTTRHERTYIVMEYIAASTVGHRLKEHPEEKEFLYDLVTETVRWLLELPIPEDGRLGPVGGGIAVHKAFADYVAPLAFETAMALQIYFNKALYAFYKPGARVNFSSEPIVFYHSDIKPENFLYDPQTKVLHMINFHYIGVFPKSFASFALYTDMNTLMRAIAARLEYEKSPNLMMMVRASGYLVQSGGPTFDLDEQGNKRKTPLQLAVMKASEDRWKSPVSPVEASADGTFGRE